MLQFGRYELDEARRLLRRSGTEVALQPRVFDLLLYLIRNRERAVPRVEIIQDVWRGVTVDPSVLSAALQKLRKALADETGACPWVETVHGFGIRFQGEVEVSTVRTDDSAPAITVLAPRRIAEASRDLTLLTCEALLLQLHQFRALSTLDAELVTDGAGRLLRSARTAKLRYVLGAHASRRGNESEALARLTDLATLRMVWSGRVAIAEADPALAARSLAAQVAESVSTHLMLGRFHGALPEEARGAPLGRVRGVVAPPSRFGMKGRRMAE